MTSIDQGAMVDTHVLIFGCRASKNDPEDRLQLSRSCRDLLNRMDQVHVSCVVWVEFFRYVKQEEAAFVQRIRKKFRAEAFDVRAADRAATLLKARGMQGGVCRRCLNTRDTHTCKTCGATVASQQRVADAMIAAHAEVLGRNLYTCDRGIRAFSSEQLKENKLKIQLLDPPNPDGPLFERT